MPATPFTLTLSIPAGPAVLSTPLRVTTLVRSQSTTALSLPAPGTRSPVTYRLLSADGASVIAEVSQVLASMRRSLGGEGPPAMPASLAPGGTLGYSEDIAPYFVPPPPPGRYLLEAVVNTAAGGAASPRVPLELVPLAPLAVLRAADDDGAGLDTLVLHRAPNGPRPYFGLGDVHATVPRTLRPLVAPDAPAAGDPASGIALAVNTAPRTGARWFATLHGGTLRGGLARAYDVAHPFADVAVGLERPRLAPRAFQGETGAWFLVFGSKAGESTLALVEVGAQPPRVRHVALRGAPTPSAAVGWLFPEGRLQFVWTVPDGPGARLLGATLDPAEPPDALVVETELHRTPVALAGLRVPALITAEFDGVEWLELPADGGWPVVKRWHPGQPVVELTVLPETTLLTPRVVANWVLPDTGSGVTGLLAQSAQGAWACRGGSWVALQAPPRANLALHGLSEGRQLAAWWPDPRSGLGVQVLP